MSKKLVLSGVLLAIIIIGGLLLRSQWRQATVAQVPATGFTLHIDAKKHINELPDWVVHHYCKTISAQVRQCLLFDADDANAKLIGVETIISPQLYATLPDRDKSNWHYHKAEIPQVEAVLPGMSAEEVQKVVAALEDTYGKVVIFWDPRDAAPSAPVSITTPH